MKRGNKFLVIIGLALLVCSSFASAGFLDLPSGKGDSLSDITGKAVSAGSACNSNSECITDLCSADKTGNKICKCKRTYSSVGGTKTVPGDCPVNQFCSPDGACTNKYPAEGVCLRNEECTSNTCIDYEGQKVCVCMTDADCGDAAKYCPGSYTFCKAKKELKGDCVSANECLSNACANNMCISGEKYPAGHICLQNEECTSNNCIEYTDIKVRDINGQKACVCMTDADCGDAAKYCPGPYSFCEVKKELNDYCFSASECLSNACANKRCVTKVCTQNSDCGNDLFQLCISDSCKKMDCSSINDPPYSDPCPDGTKCGAGDYCKRTVSSPTMKRGISDRDKEVSIADTPEFELEVGKEFDSADFVVSFAFTDIDLLILKISNLAADMATRMDALEHINSKAKGESCRSNDECASKKCTGFIWKTCS